MAQYLPIFCISVLALAFGIGQVFAARLLGPRNPNNAKNAPYECGIIPSKETPDRFPVRFYLVALIFIVFDVEVIFLYPVAVQLRAFGPFAMVETVVFISLLTIAFVYGWRRGALAWK